VEELGARLPAPQDLPAALPSGYLDGYGALRRGEIEEAATRWERMVADAPRGSHALQIEVDCSPETVFDTIATWGSIMPSYVLPVVLGGRSCYRVRAGLFPDAGSARRALANLPSSRADERPVVVIATGNR
jgi:hypothetical protein